MASDPGIVVSTLNKIYDVVTSKSLVPGQKTAAEIAKEYLEKHSSPQKSIDSLIAWQCGKTGVTGFLTGLPGLIALPVTIPLDLASLWYVQMRMVAAIAEIYGLDSRDDTVRTLVYASLLGSGAQGALSEAGAEIGVRFSKAFIEKNVSGQALKRINEAVGFRLVTKAGQKGVVNLTKVVPIVGGVISGSLNAAGTAAVGKAAQKLLRPGIDPAVSLPPSDVAISQALTSDAKSL